METAVDRSRRGRRTRRTTRTCLSCGKHINDGRKKYCSPKCREYLAAQLERWSGLLVALEVRFANFWFTEKALILDVLRQNSKEVLRFIYRRTPGNEPFEDFFYMADELGTSWWDAFKRTRRKTSAQKDVISKACKADIPPDSIAPGIHRRPRVSEKTLACLQIKIEDLTSDSARKKVKTAYRKAALKHHPDAGGSSASFIRVQKAYDELDKLVRNHEITGRTLSVHDLIRWRLKRSLPGKWCFDGKARKWYKPAHQR